MSRGHCVTPNPESSSRRRRRWGRWSVKALFRWLDQNVLLQGRDSRSRVVCSSYILWVWSLYLLPTSPPASRENRWILSVQLRQPLQISVSSAWNTEPSALHASPWKPTATSFCVPCKWLVRSSIGSGSVADVVGWFLCWGLRCRGAGACLREACACRNSCLGRG